MDGDKLTGTISAHADGRPREVSVTGDDIAFAIIRSASATDPYRLHGRVKGDTMTLTMKAGAGSRFR